MGDFLPSSSSASSEEEEHEPVNMSTRKMQAILLGLHENLTEAIDHLKTFRQYTKCEHSYKVQRVLTKENRKIFHTKYASIEDVIEFWMPLWEDEGRVSENGRYIRLGEEATLIGEQPEKKIDVYDLYVKLEVLFV